ncbi:MAG TPA: hypothetical protein VGO18_33065, partial [Steroidobacteraceae bacterium]|nr:hypothetical protein [Steroidobacteraceae bacterium]
MNHVSRTITWYRRIVALEQLPLDSDDVVPRQRLYQVALASLQLAFEFGRAAGRLAAKPAAASGTSPDTDSQDSQGQTEVDRAAARMADRIAKLQSQLSAIDEQIAHASPKEKATLTARRGEISAALDLARQIQNTIQQLQRFEDIYETHTGESSGGLSAQIADLRESVPELRAAGAGAHPTAAPNLAAGGPGSPPNAAAAPPGSGAPPASAAPPGSAAPPAAATSPGTAAPQSAVNAETFRPESAGVIVLFGKWFSLLQSRRQLADAMKQTADLGKDLAGIRDKIT